jgi:(p)ppGpp synthase/HD superfamily hydrolase
MNIVDRAREFAREKHAAQLRKYTGEQYFAHLEEVAGMVERSGLSENATAAAWLHDVVEDQPVTVADVANEFGAEVAMIVLDLTDTPAGKGLNREERKAMDAYRLSRASGDAQSIKCADLISNTSSIVQHDPGFARIYLKEIRAILDVLQKAHEGLQQQAWASLRRAEDQLAFTPRGVPDMQELIDRLKNATGSSFEINSAIARLDFYREMEGDMGDDEIPDFCGSIDAASSLVPDGWHALINWRDNGDGSSSCVCCMSFRSRAGVSRATSLSS